MSIRGVESVGGAFVIEFAGHRSYRLLGDLSGPNVTLFNEIIGPAAEEVGDVVLKVSDLERAAVAFAISFGRFAAIEGVGAIPRSFTTGRGVARSDVVGSVRE